MAHINLDILPGIRVSRFGSFIKILLANFQNPEIESVNLN
jgi:hypothetical protein